MRSFVGGFAVFLCVSLAPAQTPRELVLKHVPEKAVLVAVVPSGSKLIEGVAAFGKAIGVDEIAATKIDEVLDEFDVPAIEKVDTSGPFVFAGVLGEEEGAVLILTLRDAEQWKTEAALKAGEDGLLTDADDRFHFAIDGNVLMMSRELPALKMARQGGARVIEKLGERLTPALERNDIVVWIDVVGMEKEIGEGLEEMEQTIAMGMAGAGPAGGGMAAMGKWGMAQMRKLASETQSAALLGRVNGDGIFFAKHVMMKPDSDAAAYMKKMKRLDKDLFRGLIDDRPAFAIGAEWELPSDTQSLTKMFMNAMLESSTADDGLKAKAAKAMASLDQMTGMSGATGASENGKMVASNAVYTGDPKGYMDNLAAFQEVNQQLMSGLMPGVKMDVKQSQEEIGGVAATILDFEIKSEDPGMSGAIEAMYGGPMAMAAAAHGPGIVMTTGASAGAKAQLAKLIDSAAKPFSSNAQVTAAMGTISPGPHACGLIDLPRFGQMAVGMASGMGLPIPPIKFPDMATPLVAIGCYVQEAGFSMEMNVPSGAIKPIVDTIKAAMSPPKEGSQ